jgi:transposase
MSENRDFPKLEPVGVSDDGQRHYYDGQAKQALIRACLQPGASLAGLALKAGLNANLLRKWVRKHQEKGNAAVQPVCEERLTAFAPVVEVDSVEPAMSVKSESSVASVRREPVRASQRPSLPSRLVAKLPNGVSVELECAAHDAAPVTAMIETSGRCHVPARR